MSATVQSEQAKPARKRRVQGDTWVSKTFFTAMAGIVVLVIVAIILFVASRAFQSFTVYHLNPLDFFLGTKYNPYECDIPDAPCHVGIFILIVGSFLSTLLAVILSTPIALAVAIFVSEIAPARGRQFMQPILELLTGIPSIIYGILAVLLVVPLVREAYNFVAGGFFSNGFGLVAAAIVLAIMILPTITTLSIDALRSLPNGLREASLALGATRWETIRKTLLPAGMTGITTGVILGMGRAIGETLAVAFVIGGAAGKFPFGFTDQWPFIKFFPTSSITVQILFDFKEAANPSTTYSVVWTLAFVLLVISFLFVVLSRWVASRSVYNTMRSPRARPRLWPRLRELAGTVKGGQS
ncbi:MAG TPA: phosphate ABC transporter permease subunit PstC [Ktedonobacterales bacterium]|jgi:phosphate transport system permease protein|nr:phosphate ABC transporter permease subunit PstC [Ktedonobacterales bacterium]